MKRKYIFGGCLVLVICYVALTILAVLSFRPPQPYKMPYGTWRSDDPAITFTITGSSSKNNRGIYQKDGNDVNIIVSFHVTFNNFRILNQNALREGVLYLSYTYLSGRFEVIEDRMYYSLFPHFQELSGFDVIVFERVLED